VPVDVKFCGLTRREDAALGASIGARYLGVVFAESPRRIDAVSARAIFTGVPHGPKRVGVFGPVGALEIAQTAGDVGLDVVQLHSDPSADDVRTLRSHFDGEIWAACRVAGGELPEGVASLAQVADRLLIDSRAANGKALGGTGTSFDWNAVAGALSQRGLELGIVLAGGLTPANVGRAIEALSPSVVDVSSGVEESPGIKNEALMRAFVEAVGAAGK
jgi:phosphoribosylanthranilate isomerase